MREPTFWLPRSVRFTRRIHDVVLHFYRGEQEPLPPTVEGETPDLRPGVSVRQEQRAARRMPGQVRTGLCRWRPGRQGRCRK